MTTCTVLIAIAFCAAITGKCQVTGTGIYVFDGDESAPTGALPNNSLVISRPGSGSGFRFRFVCYSNQTDMGQIIGTGGRPLNSSRFNVTISQRNQSVDVLVSNRGGKGGQNPIDFRNQGVYTCILPGVNGIINIGIYPNSSVKKPHITSLMFDTTTRSFICTSTGSPATTVTWTRDGQLVTTNGITYQLTQRVTDRSASTYENLLTLTTVEDVGRRRYECAVGNALGNSTRIFSTSVSAYIESTGTESIGSSYTLICRAIVSGIVGTKVNIQWKKQVGNQEEFRQSTHTSDTSHELEFPSLMISDAGRYICTVSIVSNYLNKSMMNDTDIHIQLPQPSVQVRRNGGTTIYAGTRITLTCTVIVSGVLFNSVRRNITWTGPNGEISSNGRITVGQRITGTQNIESYVRFDTLNTIDKGRYICSTTISHSSDYVIDSVKSSSTTITVKRPMLTLSVYSNITRLPNVSPYNVFSILCTATVPNSVVAQKRFEWARQKDGGKYLRIRNNNAIKIMYSGLQMTTSSSTLQVTERSPGLWYYRCEVYLADVNETQNVDPINVTGQQNPQVPARTEAIHVNFTSAVIVWRVQQLAFTPEVYVVKYGTSMDSLSITSNEIPSATNFTERNKMFSIKLSNLMSNTIYFYKVVANNTHGSSSSAIHSFTTENALQVKITATGIPSDANTYTLTCTVSVFGVTGTPSIKWSGPAVGTEGITIGNTVNIGAMISQKQLTFRPRMYSEVHIGEYTCNATISSQVEEEIWIVRVILPSPSVVITNDGSSPIYAGSVLTLTCTITLPLTFRNVSLAVNSTIWTGPNGRLHSGNKYIVSGPQQLSSGIYTSTVTFRVLQVMDSGNYSCQANASHSLPLIDDGVGLDTGMLVVQRPNLTLSLISNMTRLPNVVPYNTFTIVCIASVPLGVNSPKTFQWKRRVNDDCLEGSKDLLNNNDSFEIVNKDSNMSLSVSILSVKETMAGSWSYCCQAVMDELTIMSVESTSIIVTGEAMPEEPTNLIVSDIGTNTATVEWTISKLAYTPESYVVHYGTSVQSLEFRSDYVYSGRNFTIENATFAIQLSSLSANTLYYYQVIAINTAENNSTNSSVEQFTTENAESSTAVGAAVGGVIVAVFIAVIITILIVVLLWWLHRQGKLPSANTVRSKLHSKTVKKETATKDRASNLELTSVKSYKRGNRKSRRGKGISTTKFGAHVAHMHLEDKKGFDAEYNSIPKDPLGTHNVAEIPCNKIRNRFANIYPYDSCRVTLQEIQGIEGSDYINASFIEGYSMPNEYIAAQGPVHNSVSDFIRMIWEYKLPTVVMLTKCNEGGKVKCTQYWPADMEKASPPTGSKLAVTLSSVQQFAEYEIRKLIVENTSNPDDASLNVTHLLYLGWPDHGVPDNTSSLINFIHEVRKVHPFSHQSPLLVHCSAGVGRTGTFIVLDMELQRIATEGTVSVCECLKKLRTQRVHMVQTLSQYVFIHDALNEKISCGNTEIVAASLRITINQLYRSADSNHISGFQNQFEILEQLTSKENGTEVSDALSSYNYSKNRYCDKVAGNHQRVLLRGTAEQGSNYINASFISGYRKRGAYIATQGPLASTVNDFWNMMWEYQSKCIVMLCSLEEEGEESCHLYWPTRKGMTENYGKIRVTLLSQDVYRDYVIRKLEVSEERAKSSATKRTDSITVTQFQYTKWPKNSRPSSPTSLLEVLDYVTKVQIATGNKAITVMCNDGVDRSGAFICIHAQLERLKAEGVVDFFQFIKAARSHHAGMVQSVEQYIFCHEVLADFIDGFDMYANFKELV